MKIEPKFKAVIRGITELDGTKEIYIYLAENNADLIEALQGLEANNGVTVSKIRDEKEFVEKITITYSPVYGANLFNSIRDILCVHGFRKGDFYHVFIDLATIHQR